MKRLTAITLTILLSTSITQFSFAEIKPANTTKAKNVILLISDGAGINTWHAASYYRHGALGHEVYDDFDVKLFASTYPLNTSNVPTYSTKNAVTFDSAKLWQDQKVNTTFEGSLGNYPGYFSGYDYTRANYTDSAAAATALASGHKTYNNAINWSNNNTKLQNIGDYVVQSGRALGVITSVQWSHATPAGFLAHNASRNQYEEIAQEAINSGLASVIMGSGHPYYNSDGVYSEPRSDKAFRYVGGKAMWSKLVSGQTDYTHIEKKADFIALANGELDLKGKNKLIGTVQNGATLQFNRSGVAAGQQLENQPDLATMTKGALNIVNQNTNGFFLMIEGGAVDWAAHANNLPRLIEEQIDFNLAVEAVAQWVEANSSWDETLVIVTTDHGNGLLQGPDSNTAIYSDIINQGAGALPLVRWHSDTHTRELVPVYAKGAGADYFLSIAKEDANLGVYYHVPKESQRYIDNTDIFYAAAKALNIQITNN